MTTEERREEDLLEQYGFSDVSMEGDAPDFTGFLYRVERTTAEPTDGTEEDSVDEQLSSQDLSKVEVDGDGTKKKRRRKRRDDEAEEETPEAGPEESDPMWGDSTAYIPFDPGRVPLE
ncbi:MAG: hypothetical protein IJ133_04580 [Clostridia bacterium]|nr:hypothetical protein [Clostridia bacterium]